MINVGDRFTNKNSEVYEVLEYKNCYKVTVKFLETGNIKEVQADVCRRGKASDTEKLDRNKLVELERLIGRTFTSLKVTGYKDNGKSELICECDCGRETVCTKYNLQTGHDKSCGCKIYLEEKYAIIRKYSKEYISYRAMLGRCKYLNPVNRKSYWDKGITACDRWMEKGVDGFRNFLEDMGEKPDKSYEIDRIDTEQGYNVNNCRWVTKKVNMNNRSITVKVTILTKEIPLRYVLDKLGIDYCTVRDRYNSELPFIFVFCKGSLRRNNDYKKYKKDNNVRVKKINKNLGEGVMIDPDPDKTFENLHGDMLLSYIKEEHGVELE